MTTGSGIAIAGIWAAVAFCAYAFAPILLVIGPCAYLATEAIVDGHRTPQESET